MLIAFDNVILIDTSAAIALENSKDKFHKAAKNFFESNKDVVWCAINATTHESYTRVRYDSTFKKAMKMYNFLTNEKIDNIPFDAQDELETKRLLGQFSEHPLSFHDALCAVIMKRYGILRIFTFDKHFWILGFNVSPGYTN